MFKILFFKPSSDEYPFYKRLIPPMGIMYLASYLNSKFGEEIDVKILDNRLHDYGEDDLVEIVKSYNPGLVAISCITLETKKMFSMAKIVKRINKKIPVIVGGPHSTDAYSEILQNFNVDVAVRHEGEKTFIEIVERCLSGKDFTGIKGVSFLHNGKVVSNPDREYIFDLDSIPFPAWNMIEIERYGKFLSMAPIGKRKYMPLYTSRGCPYGCVYCHNVFGKKFRFRSPENVLEEIDILVNKYNIKHFEIIDDIFNLNYRRAEKILDLIILRAYDLSISFPNGLRTDLLDYNMLSKMKKAGVKYISFAIEVGSKRMQKIIRKHLDLNRAEEAIKIASNLGIISNGFFMMGFPEENKEDLIKTAEFALNSKLDTINIFKVVPFKGTELFNKYKNLVLRRKGNVKLEDCGYSKKTINLSNVSQKELNYIYEKTYQKFYFSFIRIFKIINAYCSLKGGMRSMFKYFIIFIKQIKMRKKQAIQQLK